VSDHITQALVRARIAQITADAASCRSLARMHPAVVAEASALQPSEPARRLLAFVRWIPQRA